MRARFQTGCLAAFLLAGTVPLLSADLKLVMAEPNLEKRSKLALDNASAALQAAREAYRNGEIDKVAPLAGEVQESVELAYASLQQTNKDPRRNPRWFKYAEKETRDLLRKLDNFQQNMSFGDRAALDKVKEKTQQVHDDLLMGLMEGKKK